MTLFTLLIVMALERVVVKSKAFHITALAKQYFAFIHPFLPKQETNDSSASNSNTLVMIVVCALPAIAVWLLVYYLPGLLVFILYIAVLWACLGCPMTRQTYKRYLQAANREDFEACSLYSEQFGNKGGDLSNVGKQLVFVNYRHYASVIIFFVLFGLTGMVFYSLCKEWYFNKVDERAEDAVQASELKQRVVKQSDEDEVDQSIEHESTPSLHAQEQVLLILDWLPVRITAFGFLLVGHFSKGLPVWLETLADAKLNAYDVLAKVAKASEDILPCENPELQEPLQMVKLVKRNVIFLLMVISVMTLTGIIG